MTTRPMKPKIMLDMETYGTKPGCKLMSISAVQFMHDPREYAGNFFHALIERQMQSYLKEDQSTLDWWSEQDPAVFKAMCEGGERVRLGIALNNFTDWLNKTFPDGYEIWCKPATFDVPLLEAAYKASGMEAPWNFRDVRCFATLVKEFGYIITEPTFEGDKHNSFHDAIHQATHATMILRRAHGLR